MKIRTQKTAALLLAAVLLPAVVLLTACGVQAATEPGEDPDVLTEEAGTLDDADWGEPVEWEEEEDEEWDYRVFSDEKMGFAFLYDARHTAQTMEEGGARLTINGNEHMVGLSVRVADSWDLPDPEQLMTEARGSVLTAYGEVLEQEPADMPLELGGHVLEGFMYTYIDPDGQEVLRTWFIESREEKYVFYETEGIYEGGGEELEALEAAVFTIQFDPHVYG